MSVKTYKEIVSKAKACKTNVKKEYRLGISAKWCYYMASAILTPKKDIKIIGVNDAPNPIGSNISRQIIKKDYLDVCKRLVNYVQKDKNHRLPNYVEYKGLKISPKLLTEVLSRILVFYDKNGRLPSEANINSKCFTKPSETGNTVYDYFVKKTGKRYETIDEMLAYVKAYWHYQMYFDDKKSNKQVIDEKSGNCVDLLQFMINWAKAKGYDCKCVHVKCRVSGTGHVFGKFRHKKHTGGNWIVRDIASVCDGGSITSVWCRDGYVQAIDPSWFNENLNR